MTAPTHLLTVWNPSYVDDAMDAHLRVLLRWAERRDRGEAAPDDVYVWWAKLHSPRREGDLPHVDDVLALSEQIAAGVETHLYLTDYRSLYVGYLIEIDSGDLLGEYPDEIEHMPSYYRDREADFWFHLRDIRRLVDARRPIRARSRFRRTGPRRCRRARAEKKPRRAASGRPRKRAPGKLPVPGAEAGMPRRRCGRGGPTSARCPGYQIAP